MAQYTGSINDIKSQWFASKGFASNTLNGQISAYLAANGGGASTSLSTQWETFLKSKGRVGNSVRDMYRAELIASLAASNSMSVTDLERRFYGDSTNAFL